MESHVTHAGRMIERGSYKGRQIEKGVEKVREKLYIDM